MFVGGVMRCGSWGGGVGAFEEVGFEAGGGKG